MRLPSELTDKRSLMLARYIRCLLPMSVVLLSGCATSNRTDLAPGNLHTTLQLLAERHHVCAVTVAVIKNRRLEAIDAATGCVPASKLDSNSVFQAASLSKPIFAYAVLKLVAQGKLGLDVPVVTYLHSGYRHRFNPLKKEPSDLVSDPRLQAITVRMVLNHTSGLPNWASGPLEFISTPGTKWSYSGEGFVLLQRAVETVTGQPMDQFVAAQVFKPLAMNHSDYVWNERVAGDLLAGTKANGAPRKTIEFKSPVAPSSLYTTAEDYGKFLVKVLNDDDVINQITTSPVMVDPRLGVSWGLGWGIEANSGNPAIWQWGNNLGYRAFVIASIRTGDGFVMLTNSENGLKLAEPIAQKILPGEHPLFKFSSLEVDVINVLCNMVHVCL